MGGREKRVKVVVMRVWKGKLGGKEDTGKRRQEGSR